MFIINVLRIAAYRPKRTFYYYAISRCKGTKISRNDLTI